MQRFTLSLLTALLLGAVGAMSSPGAGGSEPSKELRDFMRVKLKHSQAIVEGLCVGDLDKVAKSAQELSLLSLAETWQVLNTPQYLEYSRKFRTAADELTAAAKKNNLDQATKSFNLVMNRCVECHKYLRDVRMADAGR